MSLDTLYWSASIFAWLFFTGIGLPPVPEEAGILYAAGLASMHSEVYWWAAWPAAGGGIVCADIALYGLGRVLGRQIFQYRWFNRILSPERRERLEDRFHQHGIKFLLMARLLPPLRTGVFLMAGSTRYPFTYFLLADAVYGVVGVGLVFFGGTALLAAVHYLGSWLILVAVLAAVGYFLYRYYLYLKKLELKAAEKVLEKVAPPDAAPPAEKQHAAPTGSSRGS